MFKITGKIKVKKNTEQITDKFKKREFVITDGSGNYPQDIQFQLTQERVDLLDVVKNDDEIEVSFFVNGRMWTNPQGEDKYFNSLDAQRIKVLNNEQAPAPGTKQEVAPGVDEDNDLPF